MFLCKCYTSQLSRVVSRIRSMAETKQAETPRNHLSGPPKKFFLDGDTEEGAPKGRCQTRGVWGHLPVIFAEFDLILEAFCAF